MQHTVLNSILRELVYFVVTWLRLSYHFNSTIYETIGPSTQSETHYTIS